VRMLRVQLKLGLLPQHNAFYFGTMETAITYVSLCHAELHVLPRNSTPLGASFHKVACAQLATEELRLVPDVHLPDLCQDKHEYIFSCTCGTC
jgi:hypothetical protein